MFFLWVTAPETDQCPSYATAKQEALTWTTAAMLEFNYDYSC